MFLTPSGISGVIWRFTRYQLLTKEFKYWNSTEHFNFYYNWIFIQRDIILFFFSLGYPHKKTVGCDSTEINGKKKSLFWSWNLFILRFDWTHYLRFGRYLLPSPTRVLVFFFQIEIPASYSLWFSKDIRANRSLSLLVNNLWYIYLNGMFFFVSLFPCNN
jgi:hypothetical protein